MTKGERFLELLAEYIYTTDVINRERNEMGHASSFYVEKLELVGQEISNIIDYLSE